MHAMTAESCAPGVVGFQRVVVSRQFLTAALRWWLVVLNRLPVLVMKIRLMPPLHTRCVDRFHGLPAMPIYPPNF